MATGLICGLYLLWTLFGHGSHATNKVVSDVISPVIGIGAILWSLGLFERRGAARDERRGSLCALLLTLGLTGYTTGATIYAIYDLILHQSPFPSWADAGYLVGTISTITGILVFPSRRLPALVRARVLLDSLMVMAALMTFSWFFALGPTVLDGESSIFARVLGGAYPIVDLAMLFCVLALSSQNPEPTIRRIRNLVAFGVLGYVVADVTFGYQTLHGTYDAGGPIDVGWMVANLFIAPAALALKKLKPSAVCAEEIRTTPAWRAILPYAFVPAVAALLLYVHRERVGGPLAAGVYILSGVLVALILVRQVLAIAENARLYRYLQAAYKELEALATTDGMTGLPNHRVFQERIRREISRGAELRSPLAVLLVDVDRFKQYNDSFGHPAGDEALKIVARVIREALRADDLPARYGGEEFAVILPDADLGGAKAVAERIRLACEATAFPNRTVTLSIGISSGIGREPGELIEAADRALYSAKHRGRNQVVTEADAEWTEAA